jgi:hypothetical protein
MGVNCAEIIKISLGTSSSQWLLCSWLSLFISVSNKKYLISIFGRMSFHTRDTVQFSIYAVRIWTIEESHRNVWKLKGTVSWDRFQNFWQKFTELGPTKGRCWFFNFFEAPMILKRKKLFIAVNASLHWLNNG